MFDKPVRIGHLYADLLNIYGDRGNVLCLVQRCKWRGIPCEVENISLGDSKKKFSDFDLFFIGGGQDVQQEVVAKDFLSRKQEFCDAVNAGAVVLSICGGYQLLGNYYQASTGEKMEGLGILDVYTEAVPDINCHSRAGGNPGKSIKQDRLVGNVVAELLIDFKNKVKDSTLKTIVGFENHSGRTFLNSNQVKPLAKVIHGFGNNGQDGFEGAVCKNVFGTYLHGSLLPKNPHLADELLYRAVQHSLRTEEFIEDFLPLDDRLEVQAHTYAQNL